MIGEHELVGPFRELRAEVATLDPSPFHPREMVDKADDREQAIVGSPAQLGLSESLRGRHHLLALPANESEQELGLVR
jgi:hypothetical protein